MNGSRSFRVLNIYHTDDKEQFINSTKRLKNVEILLEEIDHVEIDMIADSMDRDDIDLCFLHPEHWEIALRHPISTNGAIIIYSSKYEQLDNWLEPNKVVKVPKEYVRTYWIEIVAAMQRNPEGDLGRILASVFGSEDSDSPHKLRNIEGPMTLFRMMQRDGLVSPKLDSYLENARISNSTGKTRTRYTTAVSIPFRPPCSQAPMKLGKALSALVIDDDHRRGWSALISSLLTGSCKGLAEAAPSFESGRAVEFTLEPACSDGRLEGITAGNIWDVRQQWDSDEAHVICMQQTGRTLPESDRSRGSRADITAVEAFLSHGEGISHKDLMPVDLAIIDYRAQNEHADVPAKDVSGLQIIELIRELDPSLPIIVFTASAKANTVLCLLKYDILGYYQKPEEVLNDTDQARYELLVAMMRVASEYWWLRLLWGINVWILRENPGLKDPFMAREFTDYLFSRIGIHSQEIDSNGITIRSFINKTIRDRLEHITDLFVVERMAKAGTIDRKPTRNLKSEAAVQMGIAGDYLFGGGGEIENPYRAAYRAYPDDQIGYYCSQIAKFTRNMGAHGKEGIFSDEKYAHIFLLMQILSQVKAMYADAIPASVLQLVPSEYRKCKYSSSDLMQQFRSRCIDDAIIYDGAFGEAFRSSKTTLNGELTLDLERHLEPLGKLALFTDLETDLQDPFSVKKNLPSRKRRESMALLLKKWLEDSEDADQYLVFVCHYKNRCRRTSDCVLLSATYLLLARQIDALQEGTRDLDALRDLALIGAQAIMDRHMANER